MRRKRPVVPIDEAIAYAVAEVNTDYTTLAEYYSSDAFLYQRQLQHAQYMHERAERIHRALLDAKAKGARYLVGAARTPRLPHNGGPKCIAIVIDPHGCAPVGGVSIATDDPDEIDRTVNDDRPIYDPRFWRAWREERELDEIEALDFPSEDDDDEL